MAGQLERGKHRVPGLGKSRDFALGAGEPRCGSSQRQVSSEATVCHAVAPTRPSFPSVQKMNF
jgi:hypothetical protein